jgi:hypothetical protein
LKFDEVFKKDALVTSYSIDETTHGSIICHGVERSVVTAFPNFDRRKGFVELI